MQRALAVTFDVGQTLAELDTGLLSERLSERGFSVPSARLEENVAGAWEVYNRAIREGLGGHPWRLLMATLLERSGVEPGALSGLCDFFWSEQPRKNLWRRPVPGMIELARDLGRLGVPVGALSNSEGGLVDLFAELGWQDVFAVVADSGRLGMEKPSREIFAWTAERLGVPMDGVVHIGDSYMADVAGALDAGMSAIWFRGDPAATPRERLSICQDAPETREALRRLGFPGL